MRADIVQVLDWAIDDHEGMVKACEAWRPAHEHCPSCQRRARHAARLRELRDAIELDRIYGNATAATNALLTLCREVLA